MVEQLLIGGMVVIGTVLVQVVFISISISVLSHMGRFLVSPPQQLKVILILVCLVLWLVAGLSVSAWLWAGTFLLLDVFQSLEEALYFSIVTFTTLGYGDIVLNKEWRIMASLTAVNGLIIVGLNTAFLVEAIARIRNAQTEVQHD